MRLCSVVVPGSDLSHPSNNGRKAQGPGPLRDTVWGRAPHGGVFFRKRKTGCKHKLYFLEKECASPHACLFISPGSTGSRYGDSGLPLALPLVHVPQLLRHSGPSQLFCPVWGRRACLQSQMALAAQDWALPSGCRPATQPLPPHPPASLPQSSSFVLRFLTLNIFLNLRLG